ncbi:MAG: stage III sporulation protein AB [Lachnospiraceae bacterium]|nr:stage III sporulation protein AB [Lachnospiraceae bacterium]
MLKVLGILCILAGTVGIGRELCGYLNNHLKQLLECREIFTQADTQREYLRLPYAQLLRRIAKGKSRLFGDILYQIAEEMEKSKEADIGKLWEEAFLSKKGQLLLDKEEQELFVALARSLGLEGNHTKVSEIYFLQLEDEVVQAMEEKKEKQKLYGTISVLSGLFLVILLL